MAEPTLTVRLPRELRERLSARARSTHESRSAIVVQALDAYLYACDDAVYQQQIEETCRLINAADRRDRQLWADLDAAASDQADHDDENDSLW